MWANQDGVRGSPYGLSLSHTVFAIYGRPRQSSQGCSAR